MRKVMFSWKDSNGVNFGIGSKLKVGKKEWRVVWRHDKCQVMLQRENTKTFKYLEYHKHQVWETLESNFLEVDLGKGFLNITKDINLDKVSVINSIFRTENVVKKTVSYYMFRFGVKKILNSTYEPHSWELDSILLGSISRMCIKLPMYRYVYPNEYLPKEDRNV